MAVIFGQGAIRFTDERGETVSMPFYFSGSDADTVADFVTDAQTLAAQVANLSDAEAKKCWLSFNIPLVDMEPAAVGSQIERTGLLTADLQTDSRKWGLDIPSLKEAVLSGATKKIDMTNLGVQALVSSFEGDLDHLTMVSPFQNGISTLSSGRMTFRKHRRIANRS